MKKCSIPILTGIYLFLLVQIADVKPSETNKNTQASVKTMEYLASSAQYLNKAIENDKKIDELSEKEDEKKEIEVDVKGRNELKIAEKKSREELIKQDEERRKNKAIKR